MQSRKIVSLKSVKLLMQTSTYRSWDIVHGSQQQQAFESFPVAGAQLLGQSKQEVQEVP